MKKLILILIVFISLSVNGQSDGFRAVNYGIKENFETVQMDNDTSFVFLIQKQYNWTIQPVWTGLDQTDAYVKAQVSIDGVNYSDYANIDSLSIATAAGSNIMHDAGKPTPERYLRFYIESGTNTTGTLKFYINFVDNR